MRKSRLVQAGYKDGKPPLIAIYETTIDMGNEEKLTVQLSVDVKDIRNPDSVREIAIWLETAKQEQTL